jgi:hypothetical protein
MKLQDRSKIRMLTFALAVFLPTFANAQTVSAPQVIDPVREAFRGKPTGIIWIALLVGFVTASFVQWAKDYFK